jgi:hypothetical protein
LALIACELWVANLTLLLVEVCWFPSTHPMFSSWGLAFLMKSLWEQERGAVLCCSTTAPSGACGSRPDQQKTLSSIHGTAKGNSERCNRNSEIGNESKRDNQGMYASLPSWSAFSSSPSSPFLPHTHTLSHSFPLTKHLPSILTEAESPEFARACATKKQKHGKP